MSFALRASLIVIWPAAVINCHLLRVIRPSGVINGSFASLSLIALPAVGLPEEGHWRFARHLICKMTIE